MSYIQGFLLPVLEDRKADYVALARKSWPLLKEYGAVSMCEAWGDSVPDGKLTSFPMAVKKNDDEVVVFSWIVWPDKEAFENCFRKMQEDTRWHEVLPDPDKAPFDMKRMIFGGFEPVFEG